MSVPGISGAISQLATVAAEKYQNYQWRTTSKFEDYISINHSFDRTYQKGAHICNTKFARLQQLVVFVGHHLSNVHIFGIHHSASTDWISSAMGIHQRIGNILQQYPDRR